MKKLFFLLVLLLLSNLSFGVITLDLITPVGNNTDLGSVSLGEGFYGDTPGNIELRCTSTTGPWTLSAALTQELTSAEGFSFPAGSLKWKGYHIDASASFAQSGWTSYLLVDDTIATGVANTPAQLLLGTSVYVPSVMAEGSYDTNIIFTLTE